MAYKVIILYRLYMPSFVLGTFTEYPQSVIKNISDDYRKQSYEKSLEKTNKKGQMSS